MSECKLESAGSEWSPHAGKRYRQCLQACASSVTIWSLLYDDDSYIMMNDGEGQYFYVIWPQREQAETSRTEGWEEAEPASIDVVEFISDWLPRMKREQIGLSVFPLNEDEGWLFDPGQLDRFQLDLLAELKRANEAFVENGSA